MAGNALTVPAPPDGFVMDGAAPSSSGIPAPPDGFSMDVAPQRPDPDMAGANKTFSQTVGQFLLKAKNFMEQANTDLSASPLTPTFQGMSNARNMVQNIGRAEAVAHPNDPIFPAVEASVNAGTGLLFGFPAYIGGAISGLTDKYALGEDVDPKQMAETMSKVFTYQPVTQRGNQFAGDLMYPLEKLQEGASWAGHRVTDLATGVGMPTNTAAAAGAITDSTLQTLPAILLGELGRKMGGEQITSEDMTNVAKLAAGKDATPEQVNAVEDSLRETYQKTGVGPYSVLAEANKDPSIIDEMKKPEVGVPNSLQQYQPEAIPEEPVSKAAEGPALNTEGMNWAERQEAELADRQGFIDEVSQRAPDVNDPSVLDRPEPETLTDAGLEDTPADRVDAALAARAREIDQGAFEQAAAEHADDDAAFMGAIKEIVRNGEDQGAETGAGGEAVEWGAEASPGREAGTGERDLYPGGNVELHAGINVASALKGFADDYSPYVGVQKPTPPGAPKLVGNADGYRPSPLGDALRKVFAPASRGPLAERQAGIMRANFGQMARQQEVALEKLKGIAADFDKMGTESNIGFIDAMERGNAQPSAKLQRYADELRGLLDSKREEVQALGNGQLENFDENYFPHIWRNPESGLSLFRRRPLEGSRAFLKQRSIPFTTDGLRWRAYDQDGEFVGSFDTEDEAKAATPPGGRVGEPLQPITTNPVELALLKAREMDRYVYGQKIFGEMKESGLARFVRFGDRAPEGWTKIDDRIARVWSPSDVTVREAYDKRMMGQLQQFAQDIGVQTQRGPNIGKGADTWGYTSPGGDVVTKFGGPETILTHELGHQLDFKYGLAKDFADTPVMKKEMRALADLRYEGQEDVPLSFKRYVRQGSEKIANMVHAYVHAPAKFQAGAPTAYARFNEFLDSHPELAGLKEIKPSLVLGSNKATVGDGGMILRGEYYAPDEAATLINNHLSPGLQGNAFFDAWRGIGSAMNSAQLGLSLFHVGFTTMDSMISRVALGIKQMSRGDLGEGAQNIAVGASPAQPFLNIVKGDRLLRAYLGRLDDPSMAPIVDAIQQAGGRVKMDDFYRNTTVNAFKQALRAGDQWGAAKSLLPTILDRMSAPIFEWLVPRQKLGVFFDMAKDWLAKNPSVTLEEKRAGLGKLWDSVDNRMGQLVYDNVFWNRALKDGLMASVRSVGWNLGTFRELGGGVADIKEIAKNRALTDRTAYVVALPLMAATYGALLNYAYTGAAPQDLKDCFFPRTGRIRPDGSEDRVSLPTYMKDVYGYANDLSNAAKYGTDPFQTLENKTTPLIGVLADMAKNQDYFGAAIRNPTDPIVRQMSDEAEFLAKQVEPFSLSNYQQQAKTKGEEPSVEGYLTSPSMFGVAPAPGYITKSAAQLESAQVSRLRQPLIDKYREQIRAGADPDILIPAMVRSGLTRSDIRYVIRSANETGPTKIKAFGDAE